MDHSQRKQILKKILIVILIAAAALLFFRFLFPCLLPFILAFATAYMIEPVIKLISAKLHLRRSFSAVLCVLVVLLSILGFIILVLSRLIYEAIDFVKELPEIFNGIMPVIRTAEAYVDGIIEKSPASAREYIIGAIDSIISSASGLPARISSGVITRLTDAASSAPRLILFCVTYAVGSLFISVSFPEILSFIKRQVPDRLRRLAKNLKSDLLDGMVLWLKAQLTMMLITFGELTLALTLLHFRYAIIIAIITAIIDALPVLGTGVVLLPWAAIMLISGDTASAIGLTITYVIVTAMRSLLEPKLIADRFGINPAAALLAMYTGFRLVGVTGMVLFPFALMMVGQLNNKGYIRLWK